MDLKFYLKFMEAKNKCPNTIIPYARHHNPLSIWNRSRI